MNLTDLEQEAFNHILALFTFDDMPYPDHDGMRYGAMRVHVLREDLDNFQILYQMLMFSDEDHRIMKFHGFNNFFFLYGRRRGVSSRSGWNDFPLALECLPDEPNISLTADSDGFISDRLQRQAVNPEANCVMLRGKRVDVPHHPDIYRDLGIEPNDPVQLVSFLRYLVSTHRDEMFATNAEILSRFPNHDIILELDDWHHFHFDDGSDFSESEAVRMFIEVAITGDPARYAPTEKANTHWSKR